MAIGTCMYMLTPVKVYTRPALSSLMHLHILTLFTFLHIVKYVRRSFPETTAAILHLFVLDCFSSSPCTAGPYVWKHAPYHT